MDDMSKVFNVVKFVEGDVMGDVLLSVFIIFVLWVLSRFAASVIDKKVLDARSRYSWRKTVSYTIVLIGFLLVGRVWFEGIQSLATFFGLLTAGIAIALRDLIQNFAAWIFIIWRKPFEVGNRIQVGDKSGDVIDLRPFQFTMLEIGNWVRADQSTGRMIHMPNGSIFTQPLANYDSGFKYIWNEIPVMITFESNWQKAKEILEKIANKNAMQISTTAEEEIKRTARKFLIFYNKLTPKIYTSVEESGVLLTIRYLTEIRKRRGTTEAMWEDILIEFAANPDISLAYPTIRLYKE